MKVCFKWTAWHSLGDETQEDDMIVFIMCLLKTFSCMFSPFSARPAAPQLPAPLSCHNTSHITWGHPRTDSTKCPRGQALQQPTWIPSSQSGVMGTTCKQSSNRSWQVVVWQEEIRWFGLVSVSLDAVTQWFGLNMQRKHLLHGVCGLSILIDPHWPERLGLNSHSFSTLAILLF